MDVRTVSSQSSASASASALHRVAIVNIITSKHNKQCAARANLQLQDSGCHFVAGGGGGKCDAPLRQEEERGGGGGGGVRNVFSGKRGG